MSGYSEVAPIVKTKSTRVIYIIKSKEDRTRSKEGRGWGTGREGGGGWEFQATNDTSEFKVRSLI